MKILISLNTFWNIFNFRLELIKELKSNGHVIYAVAPNDEYRVRLESIGVKCYNINLDPMGTNPVKDFRLIYQYYKIFKKKKPDIILSFTIKANIYGNIAAKFLQIPIINNISGLGTIFIKKSFSTHIGEFLYRFSLKSSSHVFFQNNDDKKIFIRKKIVKPNISSNIPGSGVDVQKFSCNRTKNKGDKFLFVGRLISDKGVFEYLKAAEEVLKTYPDKEFFLVGEMGSNNKTALSNKQLEKYTNKHPQIKYLGKTDDIITLLSSVDVMVLPSYREGLSKSLIEAAAMKLSIITTNVPGCRDVVEDGLNGLLCEAKSSYSLQKSMFKIISLSEIERIEMGIKARKKIINKFSSKIVNKIYLKKINQILKLN